jgi:lipoprotein-releasing system ATP-binding protein
LTPGAAQVAPALVRVVHMFKEFTHGARVLPVLRDVNLTLMPGEMVTIIGASGAGKSTLLHCLGTLDLPTRGQILFGDTDITRFSPPELASFRNETIGFVFQFHHLLGEFTALENAMMPALIGRIAHKEARERAGDMLKAVGLSHRLNHRPGELSGGEQQRVAIARALVMRPRLLLADEPTGNLDTRTSDEVHDLLFRINDEHKMTLLVVTHNMDLAWKVPRRIRMEDGRLVDDVRHDPKAAQTPRNTPRRKHPRQQGPRDPRERSALTRALAAAFTLMLAACSLPVAPAPCPSAASPSATT